MARASASAATSLIVVAQHSTRKHFPGGHPVEVLVNGVAHEAVEFEVEVEGKLPTHL